MSRALNQKPDRIITTLTLARQSIQLMVEELVTRLHAAGYHDITAAHQAVFENIDRDGSRLTTLATRSGMTHQSMSELVHVLEHAGYLERRPDPGDGRARIILLTEKGRALVRQALHDIREIETAWQDQFQAAGHDIELRTVIEPALHALNPRPPVHPSPPRRPATRSSTPTDASRDASELLAPAGRASAPGTTAT